MSAFGEWEFTCDAPTTKDAYARADDGGSKLCSCNGCRNFVIARERVFPGKFLELLDTLGIDSLKDGEVYHNGQMATGLHNYGGWYHFVGTLTKTGDFARVELAPGFWAWMCRKSAPTLNVLSGHPLVQLEFLTDCVPWVLDEPPAA